MDIRNELYQIQLSNYGDGPIYMEKTQAGMGKHNLCADGDGITVDHAA